jgi:predicted ferric reductase
VKRLAAPALAGILALGAVVWAWPGPLGAWRVAGLAAGWAGAALLVACVLLLIRHPAIAERLGGLDAMLRTHHLAGVLAYLLILVHPLALALDAALESPHLAWLVLSPLAQGWPVRLGWLALAALMVGLASTFVLRLRWRRWRAWHHLLALAVVLGVLHIERLLGDPGPLALLAGLMLAALAWRYVVIDRALDALPYRVLAVQRRGPHTMEAILAPAGAQLHPRPGQFVLASFGETPGFAGCGELHPFTVSAVEPDGRLRIAVKALGPCSAQLQALVPATPVRLQGPFGEFLAEAGEQPALWVAGGIGITPFVAALRAAPPQRPTSLVYLHRDAGDAAFLEELRALEAEAPLLQLHAVATGEQPPALEPLLERIGDLARREVHVCGPPALVQALRAALARHGVAPRAIHAESFDFR